jgi:hypothetical protein
MDKSALHNFVTLTESQKSVKETYERNHVALESLKQEALKGLRLNRIDEAIFELDDKYYRLFIDPDDKIQVSPISKIFT